MHQGFFSMAQSKQRVNQWLCIAFIAILCVWIILYYFTQKAQIIEDTYATSYSLIYDK